MSDDGRSIARVLAGERHVYRELVERHQASVFGFLRALGVDPADREDAAQEAFLAAWRHLDRFDARRGSFGAWVVTIARNRARNLHRRRRPAIVLGASEPEVGGARDGEPETFRLLDRALADLPAEQRVAFVLAELHGLPLAEVARVEDVPVGTVKSRISRAKARLRALPALAREAE